MFPETTYSSFTTEQASSDAPTQARSDRVQRTPDSGTSVYLAPEAVGAGLGQRIYPQLLSLLRTDGMHLAVAVIAQPNPASVALHENLGFELVDTMREIGWI